MQYSRHEVCISDGIYIFLRQGSGKRTGEAVKRYDATFILPLLLFCNVKHVIRFIISCVCGFHSIILNAKIVTSMPYFVCFLEINDYRKQKRGNMYSELFFFQKRTYKRGIIFTHIGES